MGPGWGVGGRSPNPRKPRKKQRFCRLEKPPAALGGPFPPARKACPTRPPRFPPKTPPTPTTRRRRPVHPIAVYGESLAFPIMPPTQTRTATELSGREHVSNLNQNTRTVARNTRAAVMTASTEEKAAAQPVKSEQINFNDLVKQFRTPLFRFVVRHIGNPADAEDIAQQTFLEAFNALGTFRGQSQVSTWLYGIAMNLIRNYLNRAPHRVRKYESDEVLAVMADDADGPHELIERMELFTRLYQEVDTLSEELRQTFLLVAIEGRSYEEAALTLNIPIGTVRSRLFRAREAIKVRIPDLHDALVA